MAEERTGQRTYRRKPADVEEAKYIAGLINADVAANTTKLAEAGEHDKLYTLLGYQRDWNGMVKELSQEPAKVPSIAPAGHGLPTIETTTSDPAASATTQPTESTPGGGQPRSRTRTPQTA